MKREVIRVEPLSIYLEGWKAPTSAVTRSGDTIYVSKRLVRLWRTCSNAV
jgi:2-iminobutanoate/2-iminopropanoate deaminase